MKKKVTLITLTNKCYVYGYDASVCKRKNKITGTPLIPPHQLATKICSSKPGGRTKGFHK